MSGPWVVCSALCGLLVQSLAVMVRVPSIKPVASFDSIDSPPVCYKTVEPAEQQICTPAQVLYQRMQGQLAIIIKEIEKVQEEGRRKIAESERHLPQPKPIRSEQLWMLAQQLQNFQLAGIVGSVLPDGNAIRRIAPKQLS
ncbi:uncharacterized protein LOC129732136 [Wyeomyia smithii]|uniref:uncharacterized protein LOC129732136 n=1 Tax=Wyeomyia smithii TaxID=174621 RepID=UPI002467E608|nr:uncharacterized protein LOC129732136 [Wyeomyia smithii]